MSIILKGMCNFESTTATPPKPEDIAPNAVSNVSFTDNGKGSITVKWTDPDDTILEGVTIAKWYRTVLVYKKESAPTSITDGQTVNNYTKNQYLYNGYPLTIDPDVTYYFKFFTVSDKNKTNTSDRSYTFSSKGVSTTLKDNDWSTIIEVANKGEAQNYWKIGDEIDLVLSGNFNETVTLQIWDFNHFDKSDGTGKAGICFGMKHLMENFHQMNSTDTNSGGWNQCNMKKTIMNNIYNSIPVEIRNHIKEVNTYANKGGESSSSQACTDKVFLPGFKELGFTEQNYDGDQVKFPIFSDNNSRIKKINNGSGSKWWWWTRSPSYNYSDHFRIVYTDGSWSNSHADSGGYVCVCFNV